MKSFILFFFLSFIANEEAYSNEIMLTHKQSKEIAHKIWQNEGAGLRKCLVHWNKGEEFASVGIGHFIWFTENQPMWFYEAFPSMLKYISARGAKLPSWLTPKIHCPWNSRAELMHAKKIKSEKHQELETMMVETMDLQAEFMAHRLHKALPEMLNHTNDRKTSKLIHDNFNSILYDKKGHISSQGAYILIDYINFKGTGTVETERYQKKGWGLFQVLKNMTQKDPNVYCAFAKSSRFVLNRLIRVSPPNRNLKRFKRGWFKRIDTYCSEKQSLLLRHTGNSKS